MKTLTQHSIKKAGEVVEIVRKGIEIVINPLNMRYSHMWDAVGSYTSPQKQKASNRKYIVRGNKKNPKSGLASYCKQLCFPGPHAAEEMNWERRMTQGNRREKILRFSSFYHHFQQGSLLCYFSYWLKFSRDCASSELKGILLLLLWAQKAPYVLRYYNGNNRKNSSDFLFIFLMGMFIEQSAPKKLCYFLIKSQALSWFNSRTWVAQAEPRSSRGGFMETRQH